jgi:hypothetical protein
MNLSSGQALAPIYSNLAKYMTRIVDVGVVNCEESWTLCNDMRIDSYPTLALFGHGRCWVVTLLAPDTTCFFLFQATRWGSRPALGFIGRCSDLTLGFIGRCSDLTPHLSPGHTPTGVWKPCN